MKLVFNCQHCCVQINWDQKRCIESFSQLIVVWLYNLTSLWFRSKTMSVISFSIHHASMELVLSNVWSAVSSHADCSHLNSIIFAGQKLGIYWKLMYLCHRCVPYIVFFKKVNKACCFYQSHKRCTEQFSFFPHFISKTKSREQQTLYLHVTRQKKYKVR